MEIVLSFALYYPFHDIADSFNEKNNVKHPGRTFKGMSAKLYTCFIVQFALDIQFAEIENRNRIRSFKIKQGEKNMYNSE